MTDHDAIAARVRQDKRAGTLFSGPVYIKLADMADAYLDLYDEVTRLRADLAGGSFYKEADVDRLMARAEKAEAERDRLRAVLLKIAEYLPSFDYVARDEFGRCTDLPGSPYDRGKADASAHLSAVARAALKGTSE